MSNSYFQFKQFCIEQDRCAMKVSTDACIQGAWTPVHQDVRNVLDIGAGTGLLSLMLAQRNENIQIDAIELDGAAARQAAENIAASPWRSCVRPIHGDTLAWQFNKKYDLIICNPPFFQNSLQGPDPARNAARHTIHLGYAELIDVFEQWLSPDGYASVLLPFSALDNWSHLLNRSGYFIAHQLNIAPVVNAACNRVVTIITKNTGAPLIETLCIYASHNSYTQEAIHLLAPYYLNL